MENNNKRQHRELDDATKQKIANALRGRKKSPQHSQNISKALTDYWKTIPNKDAKDNSINPKPNAQ